MLHLKGALCTFVICFLCRVHLPAQDLLFLDGSGAAANLTVQSSADVYVEGGYVANTGASGMELDGNLFIGKTSGAITANWIDNMASSSVLSTSTGTVYLQSNNGQSIYGPATKFYNLYLNNSSSNATGIQLASNLETTNQLTFNDGVMYANSYVMYVSSNTGSAITYGSGNSALYSNSWIVALYPSGKLDRLITSGNTYDFPVGGSAAAQLLQATSSASFSGITRFSAAWESSIPGGTSPLSISECSSPYIQLASGGEWHLRPANGGSYGIGSLSAGNLSITGWNLGSFSGLIDNQFALVVRTDGNNLISGWSTPVPACASLAPYNTAGRIISSNQVIRNNLTSFSDATSQLAIAVSNVVLPLQLLSFAGHNEGAVNILDWETASEYNTDYFLLERSGSGLSFSPIGQLPAKGISFINNQYSFTDFYPFHGLNYYRLKIFDKDNSFYYSNMVLIEMPLAGTVNPVVISPNPAFELVNVQVFANSDSRVMLTLFDELGRVVRTGDFSITAGANNLSFSLSDLPAAAYMLQVQHLHTGAPELFKVVKVN